MIDEYNILGDPGTGQGNYSVCIKDGTVSCVTNYVLMGCTKLL